MVYNPNFDQPPLTGNEVIETNAPRGRATTQAIANLAFTSTGVSSFNARTGAVVLTAADIAAVNLSTLPTSDPGGGLVWLNGAFLCVGTP